MKGDFPSQYGDEFQDGGEFTIASSKTPALQAMRVTTLLTVPVHLWLSGEGGSDNGP